MNLYTHNNLYTDEDWCRMRLYFGDRLRNPQFRLSCLTVAIFLPAAFAQENGPTGIIRGDLLEWTGTSSLGDLSIRTSADKVYSCHFDGFSYMERDNTRVGFGGIKVGDKLEIIADRKPGTTRCYARTIRVMDNRPGVVNPGYRVNLRQFRSTTDLIFPRGNMTFSGVVLRLNPEMVVLRTWRDGEKNILLRQDTRFMDSGLLSEFSRLGVNTRVFIRGGRNFENELEAYQVIWGEIDGPKH